MDTSLPSHESSEATLLREIGTLARSRARTYLTAADADDLAQEIVLDCMIRLRAGTLRTDRGALDAFVREVTENRAIDQLRRTRRRHEREAAFTNAIADSPRSWMLPDLYVAEQEYVAVREAVLGKLSPKRRTVYLMVREQQLSYSDVAARLDISIATVRFHVVRAQRQLRTELEALGYIKPQTGSPRPRRAPFRRRTRHDRPRAGSTTPLACTGAPQNSTIAPRTMQNATPSCTEKSVSCTKQSVSCTANPATCTTTYATRTAPPRSGRVAEPQVTNAHRGPASARRESE